MCQKQHNPLYRDSGPGLDDLSLAAGSGLNLPSRDPLRQAAARRLRRHRLVERVHRLGARVLFELFEELRRHYPVLGSNIDRCVARYAELDLAVLATVGGDRFPTLPLRAIGGRR